MEVLFREERQRMETLDALQKAYQEYYAYRSQTKRHDDQMIKPLVRKILELEKTLKEKYDQPYVLSELRWKDESREGKEAQERWEEAMPLIATLQALSLKGEIGTRAYRDTARRLDEMGVRFGCLFSDHQSAAVIEGNVEDVHENIREIARAHRERGESIPERPDASGYLIHVNPSHVYMVLNNPEIVWTTQLGEIMESGVPLPSVELVNVNLESIAIVRLLSPDLHVLSLRSTTAMSKIQELMSNRLTNRF
ncbi:hypothetical protein C5B42_03055 [Candidatus Cerribacteria bacterium 'Amazon FNV 2010 28 9']|uniref:Uncharacterized protein n=1 Tax=Candidatus Cerribacteria bacterium 'Amazon FNV 2010 28 9' TaxID=2081795 RepID=A0A317JQ02_9BACT|nr:MAG: hypothetical protein C5B42_03055 [Candidatus Cerribacteria bacterium 'Amazon FNV 2010 28 9']